MNRRRLALQLACACVCIALFAHSVAADCRDCCSPKGSCSRAFKSRDGICCGVMRDRPFCCPRGATCIQKGTSRYACRFAGGKAGEAADTPRYQPEELPICGFGCALAITLAFCFGLPICCVIAYQVHQRRRRSAEAEEAAMAAAGGGRWASQPPSYPPPYSYATYGSGPVGMAPDTRAPPNSPATGFGVGPADVKWTGPAYRMSDVEGVPYRSSGGEVPYVQPSNYPAASAYPTIARSPPPRTGPLTSSSNPSTTEQSKAWFGHGAAAGGGGHSMADPEVVSRPPPPPNQPLSGAPPGGIADQEALPPPPYVQR